ncbi:MAG: cytochrome c3 family protein [Opitutae bacterium]|nr:cytochrome c3 family protein [Opitutae bacterium]
MTPLKLPPQILRLVLLTVTILGSYGVMRHMLRPASFGEYGHYRGAALEEIAARPPTYAGMKACNECHSDIVQKVAKFEHKTVACEACHGPGREHAKDPDVKNAKLNDRLCLRCHEVDEARPAWLKQIAEKSHFRGDRCVDCHVPHQPKETP